MQLDPMFTTFSTLKRLSWLWSKARIAIIVAIVSLAIGIWGFIEGIGKIETNAPRAIDCIIDRDTTLKNCPAGDIWNFGPSTAYAQSIQTGPKSSSPQINNSQSQVSFGSILKELIIGGVFVLIFVFFVWSLGTISLSKNRKAVAFALESLKTLSGFFVGALTGFLGA